MAGALKLIARLQNALTPPVSPCNHSGEPPEALPLLEVPPASPVPSANCKTQNQCETTTLEVEWLARGARLLERSPEYQERHTASEEMQTGTCITSPIWVNARDAFHRHSLGACPNCYPPLGRYCVIGAELRARYLEAEP